MIQEVIEKIEREIEIRKNMPHNHEQVDICFGLNRAKEIAETVPDSTKWIPIKERLPEKSGSYLVAWIPVGLGIEYEHYYEILGFDPDDEGGWIEKIEQSPGDYEILAWLPLPEHYKPKNLTFKGGLEDNAERILVCTCSRRIQRNAS